MPTEIGLESNFTQPVEIDVVVDKSPHQVLVKSDIRTRGFFPCDRCIEEFESPIVAKFKMLYVYNKPESGDVTEDEVRLIGPDTGTIDLADDVRQMILLSKPLKLLCREECKGLCPHCGANRNAVGCACKDDTGDARWQGLRGLTIN